ncbi:hypothetical protein KA977_06740 [Candidatus Dependentiae bacterium]|nr:hypothetical protein [Candidatus Dependentiae bacterium]
MDKITDIDELNEQNRKLKILLYKLKIDVEKYKKNFDFEKEKNMKQELDLLNIFDISNEFSQQLNPENIKKTLYYFILGHFQFKPLVFVEYDKNETPDYFKIKNMFGISAASLNKEIIPVDNDELSLINEKNELFEIDDKLPIDLIEQPVFFNEIKKINIKYIMPITNKNNNKILFLLGPKRNKTDLNNKELTILRVLRNSALISLENASLISELDQKNIELTKNLGLVSELYDKIQKAFDELKEADKMKSDYLNLISHELRTPLTSIKAYTDTLLSDSMELEETEKNDFIKIIADESSKMEFIINRILLVIELESGKYTFIYTSFRLRKLIDEIILELQNAVNEKRIILTNNIAKEIDKIVLEYDYNMMKMALACLLDNAVKFTQCAGNINISADIEDNNLLLKIKDDGMGIDFTDKEKVFKKFLQAGDINYHNEGLGLGLSITKYIVEKGHNGQIWYKSNDEGKGTTFFVKLPLKIKKINLNIE